MEITLLYLFDIFVIYYSSLHWPTEMKSKSTAIHACLIAPEDTSLREFPNIPDYDIDSTLLLYPSDVLFFFLINFIKNYFRVHHLLNPTPILIKLKQLFLLILNGILLVVYLEKNL